MSFSTSVAPARAFLRRFINQLYTINKPHHTIHLSSHTIEDLETWSRFLESYNSITYFRALNITHSNDINMASDASHQVFEATYGSSWVQAVYPPSWKTLHIIFLEIYQIFVMVTMFGPKLKNSNILFHCDNVEVTWIINQQSSKKSVIMWVVRPLVLTLIQFNISLKCKHIPGVLNTLPVLIAFHDSRWCPSFCVVMEWNQNLPTFRHLCCP